MGKTPRTNGYMRLNIHGKSVATACFGKDGHHTSGWKERGAGGFRSCRGYYMLVHDIDHGGSHFKARVFRTGCGSSGLHAEFRGDTMVQARSWGGVETDDCGRGGGGEQHTRRLMGDALRSRVVSLPQRESLPSFQRPMMRPNAFPWPQPELSTPSPRCRMPHSLAGTGDEGMISPAPLASGEYRPRVGLE